MSQNKSIEETTQIYYEWICVNSHCWHSDGEGYHYIEGQPYYFGQDCHPGENFLLVVDDDDLPIQKRVRV